MIKVTTPPRNEKNMVVFKDMVNRAYNRNEIMPFKYKDVFYLYIGSSDIVLDPIYELGRDCDDFVAEILHENANEMVEIVDCEFVFSFRD